MLKRFTILCALSCAALLVEVLPITPAYAVTGPGSAVVLVSGFNTVTPFSTSDPACAGKEGSEWNPATGNPPALGAGIAPALKGAGFTVFTAPVRQAGKPPAQPCANGTPVPPVATTYINSSGDTNLNGQALANFLAFLRDNYGVTKVDIVGHSDGGLWSRSGITQQSGYPGLAVHSYTALGAPQTGSFVADLTEDVRNGNCKASDRVEQIVCLAFQGVVEDIVKKLGVTAVEQLTSDYLTTWNPEQAMGACPTAGIAGTYFDLPLPPSLLPSYYNPSDGLVGVASALGQASRSISGTPIPAAGIPGFRNAGTFPVVHGSALALFSEKNLLNQAVISNTVLSILQSQPPGAPTCTTPAAPTSPTPAAPTSPPTDGRVQVTIPLHNHTAPSRGTLPRTRKGDTVLFASRVRLLCKGRRIRSTPFLGNRKFRVALPRCKQRLRVRGRGRVLLYRTKGSARIRIEGRTATVRIRGVRARRVVLELKKGKRFVRIRLARSVRGTLPPGTGPTTLRVTVTPKKARRHLKARRLVGSARVSR